MTKAPLIAILISIVLVVLIYVFGDIRPPEEDSSVNLMVDSVAESGNREAIEYINVYKEALPQSDFVRISSFEEQVSSLENPDDKIEMIDSIIKFYEQKNQYDFSAWYHSERARQSPSGDAWEIAGDRQYSVSKNEVYNEEFNQILYREAIFSYQEALSLDTSNADVKVKLASCFLDNEEQTMQGITLLLEVVRADSMHVDANILLGKFGLVSAQYDKSVKRLKNVLSLQPKNTEALFLLAEAYIGLGDKNTGIALLNQCKDLVESDALKEEINAYIAQLDL